MPAWKMGRVLLHELLVMGVVVYRVCMIWYAWSSLQCGLVLLSFKPGYCAGPGRLLRITCVCCWGRARESSIS
eukprot:1159444-Pelagomonas_calceolata.AAC.1